MRPKTEVSAKDRAKIVKLYSDGTGLVPLTVLVDLSVYVIRRVLAEEGITLRGRGRPCLAK
jgi:hypothetical protein